MSNYRWGVRNVSPAALQLLKEVAETSGVSFGELVTDAIETWYHQLPFEDDEEPDESDDPADLTA